MVSRTVVGALPALCTGLAAVVWVVLGGGASVQLLAGVAALAVLAAVWWGPAGTAAGCLLVVAVAARQMSSQHRFGPVGIALVAGVLTLYLMLVDVRARRPRASAAASTLTRTARSVAAVAAAIAGVTVVALVIPAHDKGVGGDGHHSVTGQLAQDLEVRHRKALGQQNWRCA